LGIITWRRWGVGRLSQSKRLHLKAKFSVCLTSEGIETGIRKRGEREGEGEKERRRERRRERKRERE
jgi:hypothetical protein